MKPTQLERRDQIALACAALVVLLVLFMAFYLPAGPLKKYRNAERALKDAHSNLTMWQQQKQEQLARLKSQESFQQRLSARPKPFNMLSFLEQTLRESNLNQRYELNTSRDRRSTPTQPMADLELRGVGLEELVNFLHRIYSSGNLVAVYEVDYIRPTREQKGLDVKMTLVTVNV